jgi:uncharacterized protein YecE (DUF72 family)
VLIDPVLPTSLSGDLAVAQWAPKVRALAQAATGTHVLFNNSYRDNAQTNAQQPTELLRT